MSRFRGIPPALTTIRYHDGEGTPDFTAPAGTTAFNIYNDAFMQADRPSGRNWIKLQTGYKPLIHVHNNMQPSAVMRPMEIRVGGTTIKSGVDGGTLLVDNAVPTNLPADPADTIGVYLGQTSGASEALQRYPMGIGEDSTARFTACEINVGGPFRIIQMGIYCADGTNCTAIQAKFGIYRAANFYNGNAMPWKSYPNATLYISQASPAVNNKYTCSWDATSEPPVIDSEKFYVKTYWNNTGSGAGPYLLARYALDMATGYKGDRSRSFEVGEAYATPDWTTVYDFTGAVGSINSQLGKSSTLFWFKVEPL